VDIRPANLEETKAVNPLCSGWTIHSVLAGSIQIHYQLYLRGYRGQLDSFWGGYYRKAPLIKG